MLGDLAFPRLLRLTLVLLVLVLVQWMFMINQQVALGSLRKEQRKMALEIEGISRWMGAQSLPPSPAIAEGNNTKSVGFLSILPREPLILRAPFTRSNNSPSGEDFQDSIEILLRKCENGLEICMRLLVSKFGFFVVFICLSMYLLRTQDEFAATLIFDLFILNVFCHEPPLDFIKNRPFAVSLLLIYLRETSFWSVLMLLMRPDISLHAIVRCKALEDTSDLWKTIGAAVSCVMIGAIARKEMWFISAGIIALLGFLPNEQESKDAYKEVVHKCAEYLPCLDKKEPYWIMNVSVHNEDSLDFLYYDGEYQTHKVVDVKVDKATKLRGSAWCITGRRDTLDLTIEDDYVRKLHDNALVMLKSKQQAEDDLREKKAVKVDLKTPSNACNRYMDIQKLDSLNEFSTVCFLFVMQVLLFLYYCRGMNQIKHFHISGEGNTLYGCWFIGVLLQTWRDDEFGAPYDHHFWEALRIRWLMQLCDNSSEATHRFMPGKDTWVADLTIDDNGVVKKATGPSQMKIKRGNQILKVNSEPYTRGALDKACKGQEEYTVTVQARLGVEKFQFSMRHMMDWAVNNVFRQVIMFTFPILLSHSASALDVVMNCMAVFFLTELDDLKDEDKKDFKHTLKNGPVSVVVFE